MRRSEEALLQEFDVPPDQLRDEIDTLIAELVEEEAPAGGKLNVAVALEARESAPDTSSFLLRYRPGTASRG